MVPDASQVSDPDTHGVTTPIVGLQVPDEAAHGLQNLEVMRFNPGVRPPSYSSTTNAFTPLMRAVGVSSGQVIQVSIPVKKGEVIGILGATVDSAMMHNSYGTSSTFTSAIFGGAGSVDGELLHFPGEDVLRSIIAASPELAVGTRSGQRRRGGPAWPPLPLPFPIPSPSLAHPRRHRTCHRDRTRVAGPTETYPASRTRVGAR